jgi:transposase
MARLREHLADAVLEAANTSIKHIKRTGRSYRNHHHYQCRICYPATGRHAGGAHA